MVLYSAVSSPLDRSKRFTLSSPGRPVHSDTVLGFSWKTMSFVNHTLLRHACKRAEVSAHSFELKDADFNFFLFLSWFVSERGIYRLRHKANVFLAAVLPEDVSRSQR